MTRNFLFGSAALLIGTLPCAAQVSAPASSSTQISLQGSVYKPEMKLADVFGRPIEVRRGESNSLIQDPTLADVAQASATIRSNMTARDALSAVLKSVGPGNLSCKDLTSLSLPWLRIISTEEIAAQKDAAPHCKVLAVVDKEINIEILLPNATNWNGKFLMGGSGGFLGNLQNNIKPVALHRGYATAITDTGHVMPKEAGGTWAYRNPERLVNFGHRATHLAQANAKLIIQAYYKREIQKSYFHGASGSGRQSMMEAQRYPDDFDGIIAACPAFNWTRGLAMSMAWTQQAMYPTAEDHYKFRPVVPPEKIPMLDAAVYAKCDAVDGLKDDVIGNPLACKFNPMEDLPRCKSGTDAASCFTTKQAEVIGRIHQGPSNATGQIWSGWAYGGESIGGQWISSGGTAYVIGAPGGKGGAPGVEGGYTSRHYLLGNDSLRYLIYGDPEYDLHAFDFETDVPATLTAAAQLDANDPDLSGLKQSQAKLIMWVGWSDWAVNAASSVDYYERVLNKMGGRTEVANYARLFLLPGNAHCNTIDPKKKTPNEADFLTALEKWVEQGIAPDSVIATHHVSGDSVEMGAGGRARSMPVLDPVDRSRPICAYPALATYKGSGSIDDAANFTCRMP